MAKMMNIVEKNSTGQETRRYILTAETKPDATAHNPAVRLDLISHQQSPLLAAGASQSLWSTSIHFVQLVLGSPERVIWEYLLPLFLPLGYPHTVTPDYTPYQIYDSLQAFASTIVGLLSSRAVLQTLGLDDKATSGLGTATYATLISIARSTISNLSTIFFAHYASQRITRDVKFYRFFADIVNDIALVIDCLSPSLPQSLRVPALCLSSASRAVCGVAGGSSKAVLSAHFAVNGNIGELNAKDGSQETVINLMGMWVGGFVVSHVSGVRETWVWVLTLLALHLWFNYQAVRSVRLRYLNEYRTSRVLGVLCHYNKCPDVEQIGKHEGLFERGDLLLGPKQTVIGYIQSGLDVRQFMQALSGQIRLGSGTMAISHDQLLPLLKILQDEKYLVWFDAKSRMASILLKEGATAVDELKAWAHSIRLASETLTSSTDAGGDIIEKVSQSYHQTNLQWPEYQQKIEAGGWDLMSSSIERISGPRFSLQ